MSPFLRIVLRTTDVEGARRFYAPLFGTADFPVVPLHEQALARGARPHWLGLLGVDDVDRAAAAFIERGAQPLGAKWQNPEGIEAAPLRDPGGAALALARAHRPLASSEPRVLWSVLNTRDVEQAKRNYAELLGWHFVESLSFGELGVLHPFATQGDGPPVGALCDVANRPSVHSHWLFHFAAPRFEQAVAAVGAGGGTLLGPFSLPNGAQLAICDDPQGAAFALLSQAPI